MSVDGGLWTRATSITHGTTQQGMWHLPHFHGDCMVLTGLASFQPQARAETSGPRAVSDRLNVSGVVWPFVGERLVAHSLHGITEARNEMLELFDWIFQGHCSFQGVAANYPSQAPSYLRVVLHALLAPMPGVLCLFSGLTHTEHSEPRPQLTGSPHYILLLLLQKILHHSAALLACTHSQSMRCLVTRPRVGLGMGEWRRSVPLSQQRAAGRRMGESRHHPEMVKTTAFRGSSGGGCYWKPALDECMGLPRESSGCLCHYTSAGMW